MSRLPRSRGGRDGFMIAEALSALALGALVLLALATFAGMLRRSADRAAARVETLEVSDRTVLTIAREARRATRRRWAAPPESAAAARAPTVGRPQVQRRPGADQRSQNYGEDGDGRSTRSQSQNRNGDQDGGDNQEAQGEQDGLDEAQRERPFVFSGAPDRLYFALAPEQADGLRADVVVAWQIDEAGAALRAEAPLPAAALGPEDVSLGPVARVAPGPEKLRFAFIAREDGGDEVVTDTWSEPKRMPDAIRIDRLDPTSLAVIGSLRVPIELEAEPGCADPAKGYCSRQQPGGAGGRTKPGAQPRGDGGEPPG